MSVTAERIKEQRKLKKLTQTELAELVNSSRSSIAQIETDKYNVSFAMLSLIADALDTTVEYLQGKTDNPLKTPAVDDNGDEPPLTEGQKQVAYFIDPSATPEEIEQIKKLVEIAKLSKHRL
ncbi:helix-turn-helix domain-containing protein [Leuconostoc mesenteroides]|jgi:transcriptional regulator with XRE-family HTH domain|uniref:Helix-turn-helix domain-containing protein n=1 Tax=Leuconostoc mesenteroides TaxID=1245 RepID=A0A843YVX1_LEUME|nr:helix-turn-helix transcriptional regulator [Leuconostoc mesenteroides]MBZ1514262.1 helix-turn-helix domain-containing protein [Leuconostoc mesenteroides]MBZ1519498.1 helix-turn-helix domain-containing protein [Leuconostoc mesenteroides]MBZ1521236.1 helix-turn-helix domain-containing protein [Leuconostoc mesenteroides]MBZ1527473.1 helix-turn-helix domain-containing protein [Leuconostoc mesenteroides]MCI2152064.1 helix-turn-helix domain-containing protein [Leuconostoc mesenteroides]